MKTREATAEVPVIDFTCEPTEPTEPGVVVAQTPTQLPANLAPEAATIFQIIERAARDQSVDIDKMERLILMQERVQSRQAQIEYDNAMQAAQAGMQRIRADANNPQTKSKYASYGALDRAVRPIYSNNGFSLSFDTGDSAPIDHVRIMCRVAHIGGHRESHHIDMPADGKGAKGGDVMTKTHAMGAAATYGKRYLLNMIFNIAVGEDDDDGNGASTSWGKGGKLGAIADAERDGLTANAPLLKPAQREKIQTWTRNAIQTLNLSAHTTESLHAFWDDNAEKREFMAEKAPDLLDSLSTAYDNALERMPKP
jgi:hypothetical protein